MLRDSGTADFAVSMSTSELADAGRSEGAYGVYAFTQELENGQQRYITVTEQGGVVETVSGACTLGGAQTAAEDAEALALWLLAGNPTSRRRSKPEMDDLRSLARFRTSLSHIVGDSKRRAHAIIDVVFPEFHGFFSDDFGRAACAVMGRWGSAAGVA